MEVFKKCKNNQFLILQFLSQPSSELPAALTILTLSGLWENTLKKALTFKTLYLWKFSSKIAQTPLKRKLKSSSLHIWHFCGAYMKYTGKSASSNFKSAIEQFKFCLQRPTSRKLRVELR